MKHSENWPPVETIAGTHRPCLQYCENLVETIADAQVILVLTRWDEFKQIPELLERTGSQAVLVDGRRMLDKDSVGRYEGIGI